MNILVTLSYKGTAYHGFQVQKNGVTVAQVFQDALEGLLGCRPDIKGCGRTDAGVHALKYALNFHAETAIPMEKLPLALNFRLPPDIRVRKAQIVPEDFHARYSAHQKTYCYRIWNTMVESPFEEPYTHRVPQPLDMEAMALAARMLEGTHDFLPFCSAGSSVAEKGDTVRTLSACRVERQEERVSFTFTADGYLYNMVRILSGTLVEVGLGRMKPEDIPAIFEKKDRALAGPTLPAKGLFMVGVEYPGITL